VGVEEFLDGPEVSILAFCDGENVLPMVSAQDHKKAYDGNKGPNTGGMGAFSPSPLYNNELHLEVIEKILKPVVRGLKDKGISYKGILYAGLILTKEGPKVLEFNCRFGDPETQAVLKRLDSDLVDVMLAAVDGKLEKVALKWSDEPAVCVVLASGGYPGSYEKGKVISGLEEVGKLADIFHAGTAFNEKEEIITAGGRVLGVTSKGRNLEEASDNAYKAVDIIEFEDMQFRKDIGRSLD
jgi:phosphoribosylamine--glycine ligase